jgi:hypothetical protein
VVLRAVVGRAETYFEWLRQFLSAVVGGVRWRVFMPPIARQASEPSRGGGSR